MSEGMERRKVESQIDFLQCLDTDVVLHIMSFLNDAADVVRASAVSHFWRQLVITNEFVKKLCLKAFPQLSDIRIVDATTREKTSVDAETNAEKDFGTLATDQRLYAALLHALTKSKVPPKDCIITAVSASSTDRYPEESIVNTLSSMDRYMGNASYWSSKGQSNPDIPETLIYKLRPGIWVISEIDVQPFEAFFELGSPIYSAKSVRFRIGRPKPDIKEDFRRLPLKNPADNDFVWTYTSPEFPMVQENRLQPFKLPKPILSIGGYLQIELLGRAQREEIDGLFYICMCHARAVGQTPSPAFEMYVVEPNGEMMWKYHPEKLRSILEAPTPFAFKVPPPLHEIQDSSTRSPHGIEDCLREFERFHHSDHEDDSFHHRFMG